MFGLHFGLEVDLWSLGCILAELYSGSPLFYGKDKESIMTKVWQIIFCFIFYFFLLFRTYLINFSAAMLYIEDEFIPQMVDLLGPMPYNVCKRGKFYSELEHFSGSSSQSDGTGAISRYQQKT